VTSDGKMGIYVYRSDYQWVRTDRLGRKRGHTHGRGWCEKGKEGGKEGGRKNRTKVAGVLEEAARVIGRSESRGHGGQNPA